MKNTLELNGERSLSVSERLEICLNDINEKSYGTMGNIEYGW